jgi:hypothetical protein
MNCLYEIRVHWLKCSFLVLVFEYPTPSSSSHRPYDAFDSFSAPEVVLRFRAGLNGWLTLDLKSQHSQTE